MVKQLLMNFSEKNKFKRFRRKVVVFRSFLVRAYSWVNVPGMVLVICGVMYPYVKDTINISIWLLAIIVLIGLIAIGFIERYLGFFNEEQTYNTQRNSFLLDKLDEINKKIDKLNKRIEDGEKKEINKETDKDK